MFTQTIRLKAILQFLDRGFFMIGTYCASNSLHSVELRFKDILAFSAFVFTSANMKV